MTLAPPPTLDAALDALSDRELTIEDRAAAYAVIHQVQLRLNRALKAVKDDLVVYMVQNDLKALGPISVKGVAFDVEWPCNAEGNWGDAGVQDQMGNIRKLAPDYVRLIPQHYEIATAALGKGIAGGDPVARQMYRDLKSMGWRIEGGRRMTLQVKEAKL
jgi:hypothetical protein